MLKIELEPMPFVGLGVGTDLCAAPVGRHETTSLLCFLGFGMKVGLRSMPAAAARAFGLAIETTSKFSSGAFRMWNFSISSKVDRSCNRQARPVLGLAPVGKQANYAIGSKGASKGAGAMGHFRKGG